MSGSSKGRTIEWWLQQQNYRERMIGHIFFGDIRREAQVPRSVYQILEFIPTVDPIPVASVSLFDKTPLTDATGKRYDLRSINLKNYKDHRELTAEEVVHAMIAANLDTKYLSLRGYAPYISPSRQQSKPSVSR